MHLKVYKFGGASVKDAGAIRNIGRILELYPERPLVIVVSAMGKTTNRLEQLLHYGLEGEKSFSLVFRELKQFHESIIKDLFPLSDHPVFKETEVLFKELEDKFNEYKDHGYDELYDQTVVYGELLSSCILSNYLNYSGYGNRLLDARTLIRTNSKHRHARLEWDTTTRAIIAQVQEVFFSGSGIELAVVQGFIGSDASGRSTTLGREGSDFTAAIFAYALDADEVVIWKDVPGLLNADPKYFPGSKKIDRITYKETLELSYYGAGVIHPDTIKPLRNKHIPLYVKSFLEPLESGTLVYGENDDHPSDFGRSGDTPLPCYIVKTGQWLLSISSRDFSYVEESALHTIFGVFSSLGIKINLMQNSAISFSVCIDDPAEKTSSLLKSLSGQFDVRYNRDLQLITIRNYTQAIIDELLHRKRLLLEQKSRYTCQLVVQSVE